MKQRLTYALVSSAACIALTAWLVPYAPMPKTEGIGKIEVLGTIQGQYSAYVTRWLDTDEVRQLLPQNALFSCLNGLKLPKRHIFIKFIIPLLLHLCYNNFINV